MKCPFCNQDDTRVVDSRPVDDNSSIRRRRMCDACGKRFTTYEKVETIPLIVIKKDQNREQYDRRKIENGVIRACYKRPISAQQITKVVDQIENQVFGREEREVSSEVIGELVMDQLKDLDPVAYVRFASVYREFKDVNTFMEELRKLSFHNHMEAYEGEKIPTLEEVLTFVKQGRMEVNIELKTGVYWYPEIEKKTIEIVKKAGMEERVIYSSFNHYSVQKILSMDTKAETAYLYTDVMLDVEKYAEKTGVQGLHPAVFHLYMSDFMKRYQESGLKIRVWTVNREKDMKNFIEAGLEAVITNYPDTAIEVRRQVNHA